ncbi:MAG: EamA family transporter [Candidatus Omnitrophota bacterium]
MNAFWWALLAAVVWGITSVIEKVVLGKIEPLPGLFYRCLGVLIGIVILVTIMIKPSQIKTVDLRSASLLIIAGFLGSFVAFIAFYKGLKMGELSIIVPVAGSFYLIAFLLGIFVLKETVTFAKLFGVLLITAGVWLLGTGVWGK